MYGASYGYEYLMRLRSASGEQVGQPTRSFQAAVARQPEGKLDQGKNNV